MESHVSNGQPQSRASEPYKGFTPLWDYVLLEPIPNNKTKGGIVMPDGVKPDDMARSRVLAAGPGSFRGDGHWVDNPLKVGDIVLHMTRVPPFKVVLDGKNYLCISGTDAVAVMEDNEE